MGNKITDRETSFQIYNLKGWTCTVNVTSRQQDMHTRVAKQDRVGTCEYFTIGLADRGENINRPNWINAGVGHEKIWAETKIFFDKRDLATNKKNWWLASKLSKLDHHSHLTAVKREILMHFPP